MTGKGPNRIRAAAAAAAAAVGGSGSGGICGGCLSVCLSALVENSLMLMERGYV